MCNAQTNSQTKTQDLRNLISEMRRFWTSIAECEVAPKNLLNQLAAHPDSEVRMALADNPRLSGSIIETLLLDSNPDIRYRLAENTNIPVNFLSRLSDDENPYVACRAAKTLSRV